eukprot:gene19947-biopygen4051
MSLELSTSGGSGSSARREGAAERRGGDGAVAPAAGGLRGRGAPNAGWGFTPGWLRQFAGGWRAHCRVGLRAGLPARDTTLARPMPDGASLGGCSGLATAGNAESTRPMPDGASLVCCAGLATAGNAEPTRSMPDGASRRTGGCCTPDSRLAAGLARGEAPPQGVVRAASVPALRAPA